MFVRSVVKSTRSDLRDAPNVKIQPKQGKSAAATAAYLYKSTAPTAENQHFSVTTAKTVAFDWWLSAQNVTHNSPLWENNA